MKINDIKIGNVYGYRERIERTGYPRNKPINTSWTEIEVIDVLPKAEADEKYGTPQMVQEYRFSSKKVERKVISKTYGAAEADKATRIVVARVIAIVSVSPYNGTGTREVFEGEPEIKGFEARGIMGEAEALWEEKLEACVRYYEGEQQSKARMNQTDERVKQVETILRDAEIDASVKPAYNVNGTQIIFTGEQADALLHRLGLGSVD